MTDIVIPLSKESRYDNLELRIALRSIERHAQNLGRIWIYTQADLPWIKGVTIVKMGDPVPDCKDANLINKILAAADNKQVAERFMFWSDDQLLTGPLDLDKAPIVSNSRAEKDFKDGGKWYDRMRHTFQYIRKSTGREMPFNFDSHCPQPYEKTKAREIFRSVPYTENPGFCINTVYYGMQGVPPQVNQLQIKRSFEKGDIKIPNTMLTYTGYDDTSWMRGLAMFLLGMYYDKSKYEA